MKSLEIKSVCFLSAEQLLVIATCDSWPDQANSVGGVVGLLVGTQKSVDWAHGSFLDSFSWTTKLVITRTSAHWTPPTTLHVAVLEIVQPSSLRSLCDNAFFPFFPLSLWRSSWWSQGTVGDLLHELLRRDEQEEHGRSSRFHRFHFWGFWCSQPLPIYFRNVKANPLGPVNVGWRKARHSLQEEGSVHGVDLFINLLVTYCAWQQGTKEPPMSTAVHISVMSHLGLAPLVPLPSSCSVALCFVLHVTLSAYNPKHSHAWF